MTRGNHLYDEGAVRQIEEGEETTAYTVKVQAHRVFSVNVFYESDQWRSFCNCRAQFECEHAYAAVKALLDGRLLQSAAKSIKDPGSELERQVLTKLQRKLTPDERGILIRVQDLFRRNRNKSGVESWEMNQLGFFVHGYGWGLVELWASPPKSDYEFWLYLAYDLARKKVQLPPFLQRVTDFAPISEGLARLKRKQEIAYWQQQLRESSGQTWKSGGATDVVDFRLVLTPEAAHLEWKQAGPDTFKVLKQPVSKRLSAEYTAGTLEIVPEATPLWHSFFQHFHNDYRWSNKIRYDDPEARRLLNPWLRLPALHDRIVNESGAPIPRLTDSVRWELRPAATEKDDYQLRLVLQDGSAPPPIWLTLPGRPVLYVSPMGIYTGPPAPDRALDATQVNSIPAPALETPEGMELILSLGLELPPRIQQRVERVNMRVLISCEIKPTYSYGSDSESLFVQVTAQAEKSRARESFTETGWQSENRLTVPKSKGKDTIHLYDRSEQDRFPVVLEPLGLKWDVFRGCWYTRLTKNLPNIFLEWVQSVPKSIELKLDPELAALANEPTKATVKLDCTEAGVDWFDLKVVLDVSDTELTQDELKALLNAQGKFVRLGKKGWRRLSFNLTPEEDERLARLGLSAKEFSAEPQRMHALQLADKAASALLPERQVEEIHRRISELKTRVNPGVPATVKAELRPYQIEGFHFLAYLTANRFGGILADDMGLGKTLQTLTWLAWLRGEPDTCTKPVLVVCPKSVMDTWRGEAERFTPHLRVRQWQGTDGSGLAKAASETDLLVMNYAQLRGLGDALANVEWQAAILDEGQYIKNPQSQTAQVARALKAEYRLALSGTPIENRLLDLWSLMAFAMPGVLGNRAQFVKRFDQPDDLLAKRRLSARVRPFLLRRTKNQVARDLPDRVEEDLYCELEGMQKTLYQAEFKRAQQMLLNVQTRQELNEFRFHFLTSLLRLRQICCHPGLYSEEGQKAESAKLNAFMDLIEPLMEEGHKVLVFSQFVTMLDILRKEVEAKNWQYFYLAGDTENRGELVNEFQKASGAAVFLISLKAGGFGLNLTAASYVVLFDPWWNPAVENQAIDRTHRIGQTSKVIAYRLLTKNSIEEKIRSLQRVKSALVADVLGEDSFAKSLSLEDLRFIFSDGEPPPPSEPAIPQTAPPPPPEPRA